MGLSNAPIFSTGMSYKTYAKPTFCFEFLRFKKFLKRRISLQKRLCISFNKLVNKVLKKRENIFCNLNPNSFLFRMSNAR